VSAALRLSNAAKHAGAWLVVEIRDDGRGGASIAGGSGIRGLADRVEALGGRLELESAPGSGTFVRAVLPATVP
jgi:signal transduction histidine kinase